MLARLLVMACLGATDAALAQNYPAKPMRMIVRRSRCAPRVLVGAILLARFVPACAVVFTPPDFFAAS
jgi:hypothetical protein